MKAGTDYFGGVMRSAGLAGPAAMPPARAAAGAGDAFEPVESMQEAAPAPMPSIPERPTHVETPAARTPVPTELPPPSPRIAELTRDPSPAVQAALRWIAAGEPAQMPSAAQAPMKPEAPVIASRDEAAPPTQHRPASAGPVSLPSPSAAPRFEPSLRREPPPLPAIAKAATPAPEASTRQAAPPTRADAPARTQQLRPTEASKAAGRHAPEVHIGTLHVTLDATTAARFAPPAPAPRTVIAAPEAPRASAAPAAAARSGGSHAAVGSGLSRSRLPRW